MRNNDYATRKEIEEVIKKIDLLNRKEAYKPIEEEYVPKEIKPTYRGSVRKGSYV